MSDTKTTQWLAEQISLAPMTVEPTSVLEEDGVILRLHLPQALVDQVKHFQERMHLYHSVAAIRYLLLRGLKMEEALQRQYEVHSLLEK